MLLAKSQPTPSPCTPAFLINSPVMFLIHQQISTERVTLISTDRAPPPHQCAQLAGWLLGCCENDDCRHLLLQSDACRHRLHGQPAKQCHLPSFSQPASKAMPPAIVFTASQQKRCHQPSFSQPAGKTMPPAIVFTASQQNDATSHRCHNQPAKRCPQPSFSQPASKRCHQPSFSQPASKHGITYI